MYKKIFSFMVVSLLSLFLDIQANMVLAFPIYNHTILGEVPAGFSVYVGKGPAINFSGNLAGALFQNSKNHAAVLSLPNSINIISGLGGDFSFGTDINELNQVTGYYNVVPNTDQHHAYFWDGNSVIDLGTLGGTKSSSLDLSENGLITGESLTTQGDRHAFLWNGNTMIDVNGSATSSGGRGVSENGLVTGWARFNSNNHHAFLWDGNQTIDLDILPNGLTSGSNAVNTQGNVTGTARLNTGSSHAFFWDGQVMNDLGTLGGRGSNGKDINEFNFITGWADTGRQDSDTHAFVWLGDEMIDLDPNDIFKHSTGWNIDNDGNVVGMASDGNRSYVVEWNEVIVPEPIPEPTTIALLGIGLAGLAGVALRQRLKRERK